jgi:uncharacterized protein (TIGR03067 family)
MRCLLAVGVGLVFAGFVLADDEVAKDRARLQGLWQAVKLQLQGTDAPEEAVKSFRVRIKGDKMIFNPDAENRVSVFELILGQKPRGIDLTPTDGPARGKKLPAGIYSVEGDELKLCLNKEGTAKGRPTEFKTGPGDGFALLVLKRVKE